MSMQVLETSAEDIAALALRERRLALSEREWRHRLRGYGFDLRATEGGTQICPLRGGDPVCTLRH